MEKIAAALTIFVAGLFVGAALHKKAGNPEVEPPAPPGNGTAPPPPKPSDSISTHPDTHK